MTDNQDRIERPAVSPDGRYAVTVHQRSLRYIYDQKIKPVTVLYDLTKGTAQEMFPGLKLLPTPLEWARDSHGVYFTEPYTTHPVYQNASVEKMFSFDLASGKNKKEGELAALIKPAKGAYTLDT